MTSTSNRYCGLVLAAMILLPVLAVASLALPWATKLSSLNETVDDRQDQLNRYRRLVQSLPSIRAELEQVRSNDDFKAFYFKAETQALAGAQLQSQVQDIVSGASGRLISTQILPEAKQEDPSRVRVRTQIQGSTDTLLDVLYKLEQARPFLFVERLSVRSSARPETSLRNTRRRRLPAQQMGELTMRIDIFGFVLGAES
ncbi:general secretion pathway protein GspM [Thiorhodococcus mannitoliphagus]|uniref:General secretion pathway protein GspM n=1 Tax=Thiorhodococcus mannitoliphagus TaxID=329406 RepID=A0A6P1DSP8_9GAMM|nr:type II secretion system protein GspM [Thiorhodococcus mannitoliphagus]NEX18735.1 general secretion pathway protein GspM [Thiorhodococcus mannitoliphagus]